MARLFHCIGLLFLYLGVIACTKITDGTPTVNRPLGSPYTMPASAYLALANKQTGAERDALLLLAAGRWIDEGEWQEGKQIIDKMGDLPANLSDQKNLLKAKVELIKQQPQQALAILAKIKEIQALPLYYQAQFHEMLASAYQTLGRTSEAVVERIKLDHLLPNETMRANNQRVLWLNLTKLPPAELDSWLVETSNPELKGWLELVQLARRDYNNSHELLSALQSWHTTYADHPARLMLPTSLEAMKQHLFSSPKQIALLLPLTGPLAGPGNALRDGFMAALTQSSQHGKTEVRVYDTNQANAKSLYNQAVSEGADFIIGPLSKQQVAEIAVINHPVPTLLLNEVDVTTAPGAYQFGLSPTNEARQVAIKARKSGHTQALIIAPAGVWGDDIVRAFSEQFAGAGGKVVDTLHYQMTDELNQLIRDFLKVSDSEARQRKLKQLFGDKLEAIPSRRQDFDMIFLLAYPSKARQIMPLLRYYFAGNVPVYAISTIYGGSSNPLKDKDLDGIIFCDMPWVFTNQLPSRNWPEQLNSYSRLYALGLDSFALTHQLKQLVLFPAVGVTDQSGVLYLSSPTQIARILVWGQFTRQGLVRQLA